MYGISARLAYERGGFTVRADFELSAKGITMLLGPSGSGKTSLLRLIAGLEKPKHGFIACGEREWFSSQTGRHLKTQDRRVGVVFQDYALFKHLTVAQNVAFGAPVARREQIVQHWLEQLHLLEYANDYPHQLSGGQQQRVALARALASEPDVLMLDEPLSAIDSHLRHELRGELRRLLSTWGKPVLWITHDLDEARQCGDHVWVMYNGVLRQQGDLQDVFQHPVSKEIAAVLGWRNFLPVKYVNGDYVIGLWGSLKLENNHESYARWLAIRPETLRFSKAQDNSFLVTIETMTDKGAVREILCRTNDGFCIVVQRPWSEPVPAPGTQCFIAPSIPHARLLMEERQLPSYRANNINAATNMGSRHRHQPV